MCNLSLSVGIVPDKLKIAKISAIFKSDNIYYLCYNNYKPNSVLTLVLDKN